MTDFVACIGCGAQIHRTAQMCPKCGAPQNRKVSQQSAAQSTATVPVKEGYTAVPWFRKRWFVLLCTITLTPIASLIAMTGEVFYKSGSEVKTFPKNIRNGLMIASAVWLMWMINAETSSGLLAALGLTVFAIILAFKK